MQSAHDHRDINKRCKRCHNKFCVFYFYAGVRRIYCRSCCMYLFGSSMTPPKNKHQR